MDVNVTDRPIGQSLHRGRNPELEAMVSVAGLVAKSGTANQKISRALRLIVRVIDATSATYWSPDGHGRMNLVSAAGDRRMASEIRKSRGFRRDGLADRAFRSGQVQVSNRYDQESMARESIKRLGVKAAVSVPVHDGHAVCGAIVVTTTGQEPFGLQRVKLLTAIASSIGALIGQARLLEAEQERARELDMLLKINSILVGPQSFEARVQLVLQKVVGFLGAERAGLRVPDEETGALVSVTTVGKRTARFKEQQLDPNSISMSAFKSGKTAVRNDKSSKTRSASSIALPLKIQERTIGVVTIGAGKQRFFTLRVLGLVESIIRAVGVMVETQQMRVAADVQLAIATRRDGFIATASHELRTPMTALMGLSELLITREPGPEDRRRWYETINRESTRLAQIVSHMLDVTRIQSGAVSIDLTQVDLAKAIDDVVSMLHSLSSSHHLSVDIPEETPPVIADPDKLVQVLMNIIENAIKFSPDGGDVSVRVLPNDVDWSVTISVIDQSLGMTPEDVGKLFQPFGRAKNQQTASIRGTGLGLYISRNLVRMMGGDLWVESEPGQGSAFHFSLPKAA